MKIGIYNRWLATLGGGENYGLSIAEHLSREHDVSVISHKFVSKQEAAQRFSLDLSRVDFEFIPEQNPLELSSMTKQYDFFINSSFMDFIPNKAPRSAIVVFFPAAVHEKKSVKYRIGWWVKQKFLLPSIGPEYSNLKWLPDQTYQIIGKDGISIQLQNSNITYSASFKTGFCSPGNGTIEILLNGSPVELHDLAEGESIDVCLSVQPDLALKEHEVRIRLNKSKNEADFVFISQLSLNHPQHRIFKPFLMPVVDRIGIRFILLPYQKAHLLEIIDTYDAIWGISEFTQKWINTYWDRQSYLLYPPVDVGQFAPLSKKQMILNVGRFFDGNHNKKHLVMASAFKQMVDHGLKGWELHFAGGTTPGEVHENYLGKIQLEAQGYPIFLHPDLSHSELVRLYGESSIYWHASGYQEDENLEPVKFEHFGITTVEAMASGCVPVVIGKGGQLEIVNHGVNGYLWNSIDELITYTQQLISDPSLRSSFSKESLKKSRTYNIDKFRDRIDDLMSEQVG